MQTARFHYIALCTQSMLVLTASPECGSDAWWQRLTFSIYIKRNLLFESTQDVIIVIQVIEKRLGSSDMVEEDLYTIWCPKLSKFSNGCNSLQAGVTTALCERPTAASSCPA